MLDQGEVQDLTAGELGRVPGALVVEVGPAVVLEVELNKLPYPPKGVCVLTLSQ
jgi:hypothetical protein